MPIFGRRSADQNEKATGLNWSTLGLYARAARDFTTTPPVKLPGASFAQLCAADMSGLPMARTFAASDGFPLAYRHYRGSHSGKSVVVLVHGSAGFGSQLHTIARSIASRGLAQVYALDIRGHGSSVRRPGHDVRHPDQLCSDLGEFLQHLDGLLPGAQFILGGHSAGGGLVLRFCRSPAGRRVSSCMFLAPYLGLGSATIRPLFGGWVRTRPSLLGVLSLANVLGITCFNQTTVVGFDLSACSNRHAYTPSWSFNTLLAFGPGCWSSKAAPIDSEKAILVISGTEDECFFAERYAEAFATAAPHAEVGSIEACGHWDILVNPTAVGFIVDWVARVVDRGEQDVAS